MALEPFLPSPMVRRWAKTSSFGGGVVVGKGFRLGGKNSCEWWEFDFFGGGFLLVVFDEMVPFGLKMFQDSFYIDVSCFSSFTVIVYGFLMVFVPGSVAQSSGLWCTYQSPFDGFRIKSPR